MAVRPPAGAPVPMTPYAGLELTVDPDPLHPPEWDRPEDDDDDSGMVIVWVAVAVVATIVAVIGWWVILR